MSKHCDLTKAAAATNLFKSQLFLTTNLLIHFIGGISGANTIKDMQSNKKKNRKKRQNNEKRTNNLFTVFVYNKQYPFKEKSWL